MSALPESLQPVSPELVLVDPELARAERRRGTEASARPTRSPRPPAARTPASQASRRDRSDPRIPAKTAALSGLGSIAAAVLLTLSLFGNGLLASIVLADRHRAHSTVVVTTTATTYETRLAQPTPFEGPGLPPPPGAENRSTRSSVTG